MKTGSDNSEPVPAGAESLRQRAEGMSARAPKTARAASPEETEKMFHELQVHQLELELQNEELRRAQAALDQSHQRYLDLYDYAPVGYLTISEKGVVLEANLTAATLLSVPRGVLIGRMFSRFVVNEDQGVYYRHRKQLFEAGVPQACDLRVKKVGDSPVWVRLTATASHDAKGKPACLIVLGDISARKRAEQVQFFLAQTAGGSGKEPFFCALARYLAEILQMDFVSIAHLGGDGLSVRTVAVWCDGRFEDNSTYPLQ
ncbi:MAG: PAS domain-containing protein, partial [bacterium]